MTPGERDRLRRLREEQNPSQRPWEPEPLHLPEGPPPAWQPPAEDPQESPHVIVIEMY